MRPSLSPVDEVHSGFVTSETLETLDSRSPGRGRRVPCIEWPHIGSGQRDDASVSSAYRDGDRRELRRVDDVGSVPTVLGPDDGDILGDAESVLDRFMVEGDRTGGRFALIEHRLAPHALAAPLHFHTNEDEYSFVLEGRVGAYLGGSELVAEVGDLVAKPRGQWHTFWNAGEAPARVLEIISPGGLERLFRLLDTSPDLYDPQRLIPLAETYGAKVDFDGTSPIVERHGLRF